MSSSSCQLPWPGPWSRGQHSSQHCSAGSACLWHVLPAEADQHHGTRHHQHNCWISRVERGDPEEIASVGRHRAREQVIHRHKLTDHISINLVVGLSRQCWRCVLVTSSSEFATGWQTTSTPSPTSSQQCSWWGRSCSRWRCPWGVMHPGHWSLRS